jgi:hypothetical protein
MTPQQIFDDAVKLLGMIGGSAAFVLTWIWTVVTWRDKSHKELAAATLDAERARETRRVEATKPFLDRQLALYTSATQAAAIIATSEDEAEVGRGIQLFWQLFWGELAMAENSAVEAAMVAMGKVVPQPKGSKPGIACQYVQQCDLVRQELQQRSLDLAHACRASLDLSWGINAWKTPDQAARTASVG